MKIKGNLPLLIKALKLLHLYGRHERAMSYLEFGTETGTHPHTTAPLLLREVMAWCVKNDLPILTVVVVNKATGHCSEGINREYEFQTGRELHIDRERMNITGSTRFPEWVTKGVE